MPRRKQPEPSRARRLAARVAEHRALILLILADVASKVAAFGLLPYSEPVPVVAGLRLFLAVNDWGVMGGVHGMGPITANPAYTMLLAFGLMLFAWSVVRLGRSGLAFGWRFAGGLAAFLAVAIGAHALSLPLSGLSIPAEVIISTIRVAVLAVSMALYAASQSALPRLAFTLMAAGALANAASYAYPPFAVVDFLVVPLAPLAGLIGGAATVAGETTVGVINLADVYLFLFALLLVAWPAVAVVARARRAIAA